MKRIIVDNKLDKLESQAGIYPFIGTFIERPSREKCFNGGLYINENGKKEYFDRYGKRIYPEKYLRKDGIVQMIIIREKDAKRISE